MNNELGSTNQVNANTNVMLLQTFLHAVCHSPTLNKCKTCEC